MRATKYTFDRSLSGTKVASSSVSRPVACRNTLRKKMTVFLSAKMLSRSETNIRRTRRDDLGIAADDDRIRVVARMAPAPDLRLAHDHEAGDLIDRVVHPLRLERGAMAALVPAAVGRGAVEHAVNEKEGNRGPGPPKIVAEASGHDERCEPDERVPDRRTVLAAHQLLELGARDRRRVPSRRREPGRDGLVGLRTDKAVIASDGRR